MAQLINTALASGSYNGMTVTDTTELSVELSALSIQKRADKYLWLDNDPLTYTITVTNVDNGQPGEPIAGGWTVTDGIDIDIVELDESSLGVLINNVATTDYTYTYDDETGNLEITFTNPLAPGSVAQITFRVTKVTTP